MGIEVLDNSLEALRLLREGWPGGPGGVRMLAEEVYAVLSASKRKRLQQSDIQIISDDTSPGLVITKKGSDIGQLQPAMQIQYPAGEEPPEEEEAGNEPFYEPGTFTIDYGGFPTWTPYDQNSAGPPDEGVNEAPTPDIESTKFEEEELPPEPGIVGYGTVQSGSGNTYTVSATSYVVKKTAITAIEATDGGASSDVGSSTGAGALTNLGSSGGTTEESAKFLSSEITIEPKTITLTVTQLQIDSSETIPAGTSVLVFRIYGKYYMQVPVWLNDDS